MPKMGGLLLALALLLALSPSSAVAAAAAGRTTVPLDLGWRTAAAPKPTTCAYPLAVPGNQGMGNSGWAVEAGTAAACQAAACAHDVQAFSFCEEGYCGDVKSRLPPPVVGMGPFCIIGSAGRWYVNEGNETWTSMLREQSTSKGADPATSEAARGFDDSAWNVVDLPHDASIELARSDDSDGPEGYQPAIQTMYRKHFRLPESWKGLAITLWVDGALTASSVIFTSNPPLPVLSRSFFLTGCLWLQWWVNGVQCVNLKTDATTQATPFQLLVVPAALLTDCLRLQGYLPLTLRLDDNPDLKLSYNTDS